MAKSNERHHKVWKSIVNVLQNSGLKVSRIAKAGTRADQAHRYESDMDVIFAVVGNPDKRSFYPQLITALNSNFPLERVYESSKYNIICMDFNKGINFDLVLLTEYEFDRQHGKDLDYRRNYLKLI